MAPALFENNLDKLRKDYSGLFEPDALDEPKDRPLEVQPLLIPPWDLDQESIREPDGEEESFDALLQRLFDNMDRGDDDPWGYEYENAVDEDSARRREEIAPFEDRPTRTGMELLAIYLPFHLYPKGSWGVLFFELPFLQFAKRLHRLLRTDPRFRKPQIVLKLAAYSIARHEFCHYLSELHATDIELRTGRRVYKPYFDHVYKRTYPGRDCVEETVANVWAWDNPSIRTPRVAQKVMRGLIDRTPAPCYALGARYDSTSVRGVEDQLAAQTNQCAISPSPVPPVWGSLPRPYAQPWTRYENVDFFMTKSAGGVVGPMLNSGGRVRKTIPVYHR